MPFEIQLKTLKSEVAKLKKNVPVLIGETVVTFFKKNISDRQGLPVNGNLQKFPKRVPGTPRDQGRNILYDKGNLVRAVQIIQKADDWVKVGVPKSQVPFIDVIQNGGTITVTEAMKSFFWAKYYEVSGKVSKTKKGNISKSAKNVTLSNDAQFWKNLALKPVGSTIKIPKRQFMDINDDVIKHVTRMLQKEISDIDNNL